LVSFAGPGLSPAAEDDVGPYRLIAFFLWGFVQVFAQAAVAAWLAYWAVQWGTFVLELPPVDPGPVYRHLFLSFSLLFFFPGQTFWTHTREGPDGKTYVIVGGDQSCAGMGTHG
jgi:hypothetical protein